MKHEREPVRLYSIRATIHDVPYSTMSACVCVRMSCCRCSRSRIAFAEWVHHHYRQRINLTEIRPYIFHSMPQLCIFLVFFFFFEEEKKKIISSLVFLNPLTSSPSRISTHLNMELYKYEYEITNANVWTKSKSDLLLFFFYAGFITIANESHHSDCEEVEENGESTNCCRN